MKVMGEDTNREKAGRGSGPKSRIIAGAMLVTALVLLVAAAGVAVSSPRICDTCHEMQPEVATWKVSPHATVPCYKCHGTPRPWYQAPISLVERWTSLGRDVRAHFSGRSVETTTPGIGPSASMPEEVCLQCHDPARKVTYRYGLQIDHAEHAKRNKSCVSCHLWTAHPYADEDRAPSLMMARCFNCHGLSKDAKAPGACDVCHLKGVDLFPESHRTGEWQTRHGKVATADREQCAMCHQDSFCTNCHGLEMPHPSGWAKGQTGHAAVAKQNEAVCAKCHKGNANLCTMCHHKGFDEKKGPWVNQHFVMVRETGTAFCMKCHDPMYCVRCHVSAPKTVDMNQ